MELRAERGRAVLVGAPEPFEPPTALAGALDEWAEVAHAVCSDGPVDPATAELVSARGRQLAARLATAAGTTVGYTDPVLGVVEHVSPTPSPGHGPPQHSAPGPSSLSGSLTGPGSTAPGRPLPGEPSVPGAPAGPAMPAGPGYPSDQGVSSGSGVSSGHGAPYGQVVPYGSAPSAGLAGGPVRAAGRGSAWTEAWADAPPGPTPWATGLTVSAFAAVVVLAAVVTLVRGLAEVTWLLGAMGLVVVTGGLAPSIWLARHTPVWRWVGLGVAAGIAISWIAVILATLGP